ncbi:BRO family protein [Cytobacillus sp. FSL R5-0569]|uniref:BRO family protein n=1 Tax=Cytobacillus sp. FSL R5-0569 TaxID=2921649 RepID=UPI0030FC0536
MELKLVKQAQFSNLVMDFYMDVNKEIYATRKQIGEGLGYSDPQNAIDKINHKYKERFIDKAVTAKVEGTDKKLYSTILYNARGIMEICRRARTEKADDFFDWVSTIIEELRLNGVVVSDNATHEQVLFNVDTFIANLDYYNVSKLYDLVEQFLDYHRDKKTRLAYKRSHKARHGNKKYKDHITSMADIRDLLVDYLNANIDRFNNNGQAGLAQEYVRIREMVRVNVENMRYRSAACAK